MILFRQKTALPDFIDAQRNSFWSFLRFGIREELDFFSPIVGRPLGAVIQRPTDRYISVSFLASDFQLRRPKHTPQSAVHDMETYSSTLLVPVHVFSKRLEVSAVFPITLCELPLMTEHGTFIINGAPRVIVHQIVRCPGVYLKAQLNQKNVRTHLVSFLSAYGSWLRFESDKDGLLWACIDNMRKIPATLLLQALGFSDATIQSCVYDSSLLLPTFEYLVADSREEALFMLLALLVPGRMPTIRKAKKLLFQHFFHPRRYSFSAVGRKHVNRKFRMLRGTAHLTLTPEDMLAGVDYLVRLESGQSELLDDIDHLKNRRARLAGELIQTQFRLGLNRLERSIYTRISDETLLRQRQLRIALPSLIRTKLIATSMKDFFGSSQLSQFMDQTNPLAEITHKRRLSSLGPGGLHRDRAGLVVRGIHPSYYGRMCPIETPEGKNAGLVGSIATYARINSDGFLETPYQKYIPTDPDAPPPGFMLLSAAYEDTVVVAASDIQHAAARVPSRTQRQFLESAPKDIDFLGLCPIQFMSIATSLIPFLEHDDANRALMGSNMQRQAVPLLVPERAFVGTGLEGRVTRDAGTLAVAPYSGYVIYADAKRIDLIQGDATVLSWSNPVNGITSISDLEPGKRGLTLSHTFPSLNVPDLSHDRSNETSSRVETIWLTNYQRSNQDTCMHQRPSVHAQSWVEAGDCLADNASTDGGELALGKNILIAYMPWEGYNFEDAVLVSERLVYDDVFTSVHIERYDISTGRTREGQQYITRKVDQNQDLDAEGVIRVGTWVEPGDVLVGCISPQAESENTPETRLIRAIFGGAARDFRDTPLEVPNGVTGRVLECRTAFDRQDYNEQVQAVESEGTVYVFLVQKRKVQVGDKVAGRHGNKGIISNILPRQDMPFLQNGVPVDMVLNPLGVPSRMNVGQIFECLLGLAAQTCQQSFKVLPFDEMHGSEVSRGFVYQQLYMARQRTHQKWLFRPASPGKSILFDGRTGDPFEQPVTVGYPYILKLVHLVDDKIHARSTGPYSFVTQQPLGGRSKLGGQRVGEMEVWALEGFGAAYTLQELLTIKSDDMQGRNDVYTALIRGDVVPAGGVPESFKVLICELRGLCLDMNLCRIGSGN